MRTKIKRHISFYLFTGTTFLIFLFFSLFPSLGEVIYGQKLYPIIRHFLDIIFNPFERSVMLVLIGFLLFLLFDTVFRKGFWAFIRFSLTLFAVFYWIWGFNYYRTSLSDKMDLSFVELSSEDRLIFTRDILHRCIDLSQELNELPENEKISIIKEKGNAMADSLDYLAVTNLNIVPIYPPTLFLQLGITGMYFPYTGQAQYEQELGPIDLPFTMAHEWFHSAGIAPEHEANFLAYLLCTSSTEPTMQYSAYMNLLNELLFYYKITDPSLFDEMLAEFTPIMLEQLEERKKQFIKYSGPISEMSDEMIDQYLKFNQQEGIQDYHRLSEYVIAWEWGNY